MLCYVIYLFIYYLHKLFSVDSPHEGIHCGEKYGDENGKADCLVDAEHLSSAHRCRRAAGCGEYSEHARCMELKQPLFLLGRAVFVDAPPLANCPVTKERSNHVRSAAPRQSVGEAWCCMVFRRPRPNQTKNVHHRAKGDCNSAKPNVRIAILWSMRRCVKRVPHANEINKVGRNKVEKQIPDIEKRFPFAIVLWCFYEQKPNANASEKYPVHIDITAQQRSGALAAINITTAANIVINNSHRLHLHDLAGRPYHCRQ